MLYEVITLVLLGRDPVKLQALCDEIAAGGGAQPCCGVLDLALADQASTRACVAALGLTRLDGLLLNAGVLGTLGPLADLDEGEWLRVQQINVSANLWLLQACLPRITSYNVCYTKLLRPAGGADPPARPPG